MRFTPSGNSMRPFIEGDKDSVILAPVNCNPRRGDLLLAQAETPCGQKTYVLHRLIRIDSRLSTPDSPLYVLQGDGNLSGEETCTRGDIIGRVVRIESPSGHHKLLTRGKFWLLLKPFRAFLLKIYRHTWLKRY